VRLRPHGSGYSELLISDLLDEAGGERREHHGECVARALTSVMSIYPLTASAAAFRLTAWADEVFDAKAKADTTMATSSKISRPARADPFPYLSWRRYSMSSFRCPKS
jgi:hypothetical protein